MTRDNENKNRLLSALITLLLGGAIVTTLVVSNLHYEYPPKDEKAKMMQNMQDPIEFGGDEYVDIQDLLAQNNDGGAEADEPAAPEEESATTEETTEDTSEPESGQNELEDQGTVNEPPQSSVTTTDDSPMKDKTQPKKDTKPQAESNVAATETKRKGETKSNKTTNTPPEKTASQKKAEKIVQFNNGNGSKNSSGGNANGNNGTASITGISGLQGYTEEDFKKGACPGPGTVKLKVSVGSDGSITPLEVIEVRLKENDTEERRARASSICKGLAKKSKFRVPKGTASARTGYITYTIP